MELTRLQQDIVKLRGENLTVEEIAEMLNFDDTHITREIKKMRKAGVLVPTPRGRKKGYIVPTKEMPPPSVFGCNCKYMGCRKKAAYTWALVPLCTSHFEAVRDETHLYYSGVKKLTKQLDRVHYMTIASMIPWAVMRERE